MKFRKYILLLSLIGLPNFANAQDLKISELSKDQKSEIVESLAVEIENNYVFPDIAKAYSQKLKENLKNGEYEKSMSLDEFSKTLTQDLRKVSPDNHLSVNSEDFFLKLNKELSTGKSSINQKPTLEEMKMIGDVAYLKFNLFSDDKATLNKIREFFIANQNAKAIIIDGRDLRGGSLKVMNTIFPFIYGKEQSILTMEMRKAFFDAVPNIEENQVRIDSPKELVRFNHMAYPQKQFKKLQKVPVYYLISKSTGSAGEHLALGLKRTKRAILIGKTTYGAAHFGGGFPLKHNAAAFIPFGHSYNSDDGLDWEGKGVSPDIDCDPNDALELALKLIKLHNQ